MLIWSARISKRKLLLLLGLLTAVLCGIFALLRSPPAPEIPVLSDNAARVAYLEALGWQVEPEAVETLQFLLPDPLTEPYLRYNELQKEQNFDLTVYCGQQVTRCTYTVTNYPDRPQGVQLNLYVCDEHPIAGDIICTGADGFQATLAYPDSSES